jgi:VanZ family protein
MNNSFLKYNWPSILWAGVILLLCLMPGKDLPSISLWEFDKIGHFCVYVLLALLMYYGWKKQNVYRFFHQHMLLKILIITSAYGFAVEIMQDLFTADRHFDLLDALANSIGAVTGSLISVKLFKV